MKVVIYVSGTRGDIQPLAALADYLHRNGDQIVFCCPPNGKAITSCYDFPVHFIGQDVEKVSAETPDPSKFPIRATTTLIKYLKSEISEQFACLPSLAESADLLIAASFGFGVRNIAEFLKIPFIYVAYSPSIISSEYYPPMTIRRRINSPWLNRMLFKMADLEFTIALQKHTNNERAKLKMPPVHHFLDYGIGSNIILACDPEIMPAAPDTSSRCLQTGYLFKPPANSMNKDLVEFLSKKGPFIYAGFGSMKSHKPEETAQILLEAAEITRTRLIMAKGWKGIELTEKNSKHFIAEEIPHSLLFPRISAAIHHGGTGTIATAARAGIPQIIIPHMTDQFFNGYQVHDRGLGPEPIWRSRLSSARLAKAIDDVLHNPNYKKTAEQTAIAITNRDCFREASIAIRELTKRQIDEA